MNIVVCVLLGFVCRGEASCRRGSSIANALQLLDREFRRNSSFIASCVWNSDRARFLAVISSFLYRSHEIYFVELFICSPGCPHSFLSFLNQLLWVTYVNRNKKLGAPPPLAASCFSGCRRFHRSYYPR